MKTKYETLDEYLDDLDRMKEAIAEETSELNAQQVVAYFSGARRELERRTGRKIRTRKLSRQGRTQGNRIKMGKLRKVA